MIGASVLNPEQCYLIGGNFATFRGLFRVGGCKPPFWGWELLTPIFRVGVVDPLFGIWGVVSTLFGVRSWCWSHFAQGMDYSQSKHFQVTLKWQQPSEHNFMFFQNISIQGKIKGLEYLIHPKMTPSSWALRYYPTHGAGSCSATYPR